MSEEFHGLNQAKAQVSHIVELMYLQERWLDAEPGDEELGQDPELYYDGDGEPLYDPDGDPVVDEDEIREKIEELPLEFSVRSNWMNPFAGGLVPGEFQLLMCTGGPAVRIVGELGSHNEPQRVEVQYQDWFTPWTAYDFPDSQSWSKVLEFCEVFTSILE